MASITLDGSASVLTGVLYEPFGPASGWTWGNSTLVVHGRDLDGKIDYIDSAGLRTYNYDDAFRITDITDASNSSLSQSYSYDLLDRLTGATGSTLNQSWTYDPNGNRLTQGGSSSSTYSIASSSNRLTSVTGAVTRSYTYDSAGNTLSDGTTNFTYDQAGRMVSASKAGITAAYSLNALGQRVRKTVAGVSTYFFYDESGRLMGEYDSGGALIQEIVWLGDTPVASVRPNAGGSGVGLFYIHTDHLGAPTKLTRPSDNAIVWRWDHDPFGNGVPDEDPDGNSQLVQFNLRFPGQYFDAETGLSYNYFRDYDPATGRYVESDPIGLEGGLNTYAYVDGNPLGFIDPDGLSPFALIKLCAKGYKVIRNLSKKEAVQIAKKGGDIKASSHAEAREIARLASKGKKPIRDPIHPDKVTGSTEGRNPHYHPNPRTGSHIFYSIAAGLTAKNYASCSDCVEEKVLEVVDFFNPLAAPQDIVDIANEF